MMGKNINYWAPIALIIAFFIDGQLSTILTNFLPATFSLASYVILMLAIFYTLYLPVTYSMILYMFVGLMYDIYYLQAVGIATTLLPLGVYFGYYFYQNLKFKLVTNLIILMVLVFFFEFLGFLLARVFGLTNLSMFIFVVYHLLPTLVFNLLLLMGCYPFFTKIFGIINKT